MKVCPNILFANAKQRHRINKQLPNYESPLTTHASELQKTYYCESVSAVHQGSPLILDSYNDGF